MMPLWDYAVKVYALPGVEKGLLKLQDRFRIDVNSALWCLWAARYGFQLEDDEVDLVLDSVFEMARHTTRPLRVVRLFLSGPRAGFDADELKKLRDRVLEIELASEEIVLRRLDQVTQATASRNDALDDMTLRAERLFTLARKHMDMPVMIADEEGPQSPLALFGEIRDRARDDGP
jgi:uncharacterized protein (TIGR02444 family)